MARLVLADDSDILRRSIRKFLFDYPRFEIVGEARDYAETLEVVTRLKPDLLLMDLRMPGVESRAPQVAKLAAACACPVITMSFSSDEEAQNLATAVGSWRQLDKMNLADDLVPAIDAALIDRRKQQTA